MREEPSLRVEYLEIVDPDRCGRRCGFATGPDRGCRLAGETRLIDNVLAQVTKFIKLRLLCAAESGFIFLIRPAVRETPEHRKRLNNYGDCLWRERGGVRMSQ